MLASETAFYNTVVTQNSRNIGTLSENQQKKNKKKIHKNL